MTPRVSSLGYWRDSDVTERKWKRKGSLSAGVERSGARCA